ncbi:Uridylate kinase [Buchnera aphidicola (Thelaxes suberi)]|uniref:UMP kinase n=1 Tax=Buchnera aphidicola TaxID=9 RepID=UPI003464D08C
MKPIYRRILIKLSGEVLQGSDKFGICEQSLNHIVQEIKLLLELNIEIGIVVGAGNLFRGVQLSELGMNNIVADHIGMLSTLINGLALQDIMHRNNIKSCLMSAIPLVSVCETYNWENAIKFLSKKNVVIFSCGTGNPCFTTDSAACLRGIEVNADIVLKGTKVDGVYSDDPKKNTNAIMYEKLTYKDILDLDLKVMDLTSFTLAREYGIPICIFNITKPKTLYKIILGKKEGTLISL